MEDSEAGTIIWVRRKNGSWWPGKILGASQLMSPRIGTPVKLLGREDATVDWYNLEKSKRVKPFRCDEFDLCIQRAQLMPPRKGAKYNRREDAILHALQLEKQLLQSKYPTPVPLNPKPPSNCNDEKVQRKRPRLDVDEDIKESVIQPSPKLPRNKYPTPVPLNCKESSLDNSEFNRRSARVTRVPARLREYDNNLSPQGTIQRKKPRRDEDNKPRAAAASGDSSDHTPDHLLSEKTKPSSEDEEEETDSSSSRTESIDSDTYDATLSGESTGRGDDADTGNKQLVDHLRKELLNQKQRRQQMEAELVAVTHERDLALSELEEVRQQLKKQKGEYKKDM